MVNIFYDILKPFKSIKAFALLIILIALSIVGNYFDVQFLMGISFIFGSIAVLVILKQYGVFWAIIGAILSGGFTYYIFNHFLFAIICIVEVLVVGYFLKRTKYNLLLLDGLFWIIVALPLSMVLYTYFLDIAPITVKFVMLVRVVNGINNALIANLIIKYVDLSLWSDKKRGEIKNSLQGNLSNALISFVLLSAFTIFMINGYYNMRNMENTIKERILNRENIISGQMQNWEKGKLDALNRIKIIKAESKTSKVEKLQFALGIITETLPEFTAMYVGDANGRSIAFYPPADKVGNSNVGLDFSDREYYKAIKTKLTPQLSNVFMGRAGINAPVVVISEPILENGKFKGYVTGALKLEYLKQLLKMTANDNFMYATLVDQGGKVITTTRPDLQEMQVFKYELKGEKRYLGKDIYYFLPDKSKGQPYATRIMAAFYVTEKSLGQGIPWKLVLEVPAKPFVQKIREIYIAELFIMILLIFTAFIVSNIITRVFTYALIRLSEVTTDLPEKIRNRKEVNWPESSDTEINTLIRNFERMSMTLEQNFDDISYQAYHDNLTGLGNRRLFYDRLENALLIAKRNREKLGVIFLDLDKFKVVNDTLGHAGGDRLLVGVVERVKGCIRESDTLCRIGGDEFVILLHNISSEQDVSIIAEKIKIEMQKIWILFEKEYSVTASMGIAIYPQDGVNADALVKNADAAMFLAKAQGGNTFKNFSN